MADNDSEESSAPPPPPFDWEAWYAARGGRSIDIPVTEEIIERIYAEQAPRFDLPASGVLRPFDSAEEAAAFVKKVARDAGAHEVGIARIQPSDVYRGRAVSETYAIAIGRKMLWRHFQVVPSPASATECVSVYWDLGEICLAVANALRGRGIHARVEDPVGDSDLMHVPIALRAGFGELGRHGSIIHPTMGPLFRLGTVVTDVELVCDAPIDVGIAAFCDRCKACRAFCPADAIPEERDPAAGQDPIGKDRYVVDTGRCFPYFSEHAYCSMCLAVCAFNHKAWAQDPDGHPTSLRPDLVMAPAADAIDAAPEGGTHRYPKLATTRNRSCATRCKGCGP
jgi:epoxyqueuosine reductase